MIRLVYAHNPQVVDGIRTFAEQVSRALQTHEQLPSRVEYWSREEPGVSVDDGDVFVVQYNPFSYGRRGVAPWLIRRVQSLRRGTRPARIILVVHEAYVPARSLRWAAMGTWQRAQLALLGRSADAIVISTESWRPMVARLVGGRRIVAIPVGSNLADKRAERAQVRATRGWTEDTLVIAALGADKAARLSGHITAGLDYVAAAKAKVVFANLGAAPVEMASSRADILSHAPGWLPADALSRELSAADVFVAPYEDGVSMRRTTLAAALQHGLAVVGTDGRNTEAELQKSSALRLAPVGDRDAFAETVLRVARDAPLRGDLSRNGRNLFDRRFAWPVIAAQYREVIEAVLEISAPPIA